MSGLEVIGSVASVLQLAATVYSISKTLYEVGGALSNAPSEIKDLARDLETFSEELNLLSSLLSDKTHRYSDRVYRLTAKIIGDCALICVKIDRILRKLRSGSFLSRVKWVFKEKEIMKLLERLRDLKLSLMGTLSLLSALKADHMMDAMGVGMPSLLERSNRERPPKETEEHVEETRRALANISVAQNSQPALSTKTSIMTLVPTLSRASDKAHNSFVPTREEDTLPQTRSSVPPKAHSRLKDKSEETRRPNQFALISAIALPNINSFPQLPQAMESVESFHSALSRHNTDSTHSEPPAKGVVAVSSGPPTLVIAKWRAEMAEVAMKTFNMNRAAAEAWASELPPPDPKNLGHKKGGEEESDTESSEDDYFPRRGQWRRKRSGRNSMIDIDHEVSDEDYTPMDTPAMEIAYSDEAQRRSEEIRLKRAKLEELRKNRTLRQAQTSSSQTISDTSPNLVNMLNIYPHSTEHMNNTVVVKSEVPTKENSAFPGTTIYKQHRKPGVEPGNISAIRAEVHSRARSRSRRGREGYDQMGRWRDQSRSISRHRSFRRSRRRVDEANFGPRIGLNRSTKSAFRKGSSKDSIVKRGRKRIRSLERDNFVRSARTSPLSYSKYDLLLIDSSSQDTDNYSDTVISVAGKIALAQSRQVKSYEKSSAFSASANPDEDLSKISERAERRRIQNKIAQRNYRKKHKNRLDNLERTTRAPLSSAEYFWAYQDYSGMLDSKIREKNQHKPRKFTMTHDLVAPLQYVFPGIEEESRELKGNICFLGQSGEKLFRRKLRSWPGDESSRERLGFVGDGTTNSKDKLPFLTTSGQVMVRRKLRSWAGDEPSSKRRSSSPVEKSPSLGNRDPRSLRYNSDRPRTSMKPFTLNSSSIEHKSEENKNENEDTSDARVVKFFEKGDHSQLWIQALSRLWKARADETEKLFAVWGEAHRVHLISSDTTEDLAAYKTANALLLSVEEIRKGFVQRNNQSVDISPVERFCDIMKVMQETLNFKPGAFVWTCLCAAESNLISLFNSLSFHSSPRIAQALADMSEIATLVARYNVLESMYQHWPGMSLYADYQESLIDLCVKVLRFINFMIAGAWIHEGEKGQEFMNDIREADEICRKFDVTITDDEKFEDLETRIVDLDSDDSDSSFDLVPFSES